MKHLQSKLQIIFVYLSYFRPILGCFENVLIQQYTIHCSLNTANGIIYLRNVGYFFSPDFHEISGYP